MEHSHRYPAYPTQEIAAELEHHINIHRQAYNYTRYEYENVDADDTGSAYKHHYRLPGWKDEFPVFSEVNSKALQRTVTRFYQNLNGLRTLRAETERAEGREAQAEVSTGVSEYDVFTVWLRTHKHEWPTRDTLALKNRRHPDPLPPRLTKRTSKKLPSRRKQPVSGSSASGSNSKPTTLTFLRNPTLSLSTQPTALGLISVFSTTSTPPMGRP